MSNKRKIKKGKDPIYIFQTLPIQEFDSEGNRVGEPLGYVRVGAQAFEPNPDNVFYLRDGVRVREGEFDCETHKHLLFATEDEAIQAGVDRLKLAHDYEPESMKEATIPGVDMHGNKLFVL